MTTATVSPRPTVAAALPSPYALRSAVGVMPGTEAAALAVSRIVRHCAWPATAWPLQSRCWPAGRLRTVVAPMTRAVAALAASGARAAGALEACAGAARTVPATMADGMDSRAKPASRMRQRRLSALTMTPEECVHRRDAETAGHRTCIRYPIKR